MTSFPGDSNTSDTADPDGPALDLVGCTNGWNMLQKLVGDVEQQNATHTPTRRGSGRTARLTRRSAPPRPFTRLPASSDQALALESVTKALSALTQLPCEKNEALCDLMLLHWEIQQDLFAALQPYGLTILQWLTLRVIIGQSPASVAHISHEMARPHGQVVPVCHTLAGAGWLVEDATGPVLCFRATNAALELFPTPAGFATDLLDRLQRWQRREP